MITGPAALALIAAWAVFLPVAAACGIILFVAAAARALHRRRP